tara:strand:- start:194 stop:457 length:264 start_codon:yes stop_codon:yes gene_type:complete
MKEKVNKITEEELKTIKGQQQHIQNVVFDLGSIEARKIELSDVLKQVNLTLNNTKKELEEKYGQVNIDLKDGSFKEIVEEVATEEVK